MRDCRSSSGFEGQSIPASTPASTPASNLRVLLSDTITFKKS